MKKTFSACLLALPLLMACGNRPALQADVYPAPGAKQINPDTHLTLKFNAVPTVGDSGFVRIFDARTDELVDSLNLRVPAGPTQSREYAPDCDYTKVPYDYARTFVPTNRNTVPGTPSGTAEPTPPDYQLTIIGGFTDAFHFYPILVRDSTAVIYPHNNMLEYGKQYYVTVDNGVISLPDNSFTGVTKAHRWTFTTKAQAPQRTDTLVVDCQGNGDFNTLQGALDFIPDFSEQPTVILVKAGDYEELVYTRNKKNVKIKGEGMDCTKIHYANNEVFNPHPLTVKTNEWTGTFPSRRAAFMLDNCTDIVMEDLTVATDLTGQAEGLLVNGERIALYRVHIIGSGDALQANGTLYMESCELDGGGDTILGRGTVFAYRSNFRNEGSPFSYVRNTAGNHGDIFVECTFSTYTGRLANYGRTKASRGKGYPDAEFVLINCRVKDIIPEGWGNIGYKSARMYEYNTCDMLTGQPVDVSKRDPWSRQLTLPKDADLIKYYQTPSCVLKGWTPETQIK